MITLAEYSSITTAYGRCIFRYNTVFQGDKGAGKIIGLVYMMNPGKARPVSQALFEKLQTQDVSSTGLVKTINDRTMNRVVKLIEAAHAHNNLKLPKEFTILVENLFNIREEDSEKAMPLAGKLSELPIMFPQRDLDLDFKFVWLAWGKVSVALEKQKSIIRKFPQAIMVLKKKHKGGIIHVNYPCHPLYVNTEFFLEASQRKIKPYT
jgi:hypothetical protein